jgi:hypothetical protein
MYRKPLMLLRLKQGCRIIFSQKGAGQTKRHLR